MVGFDPLNPADTAQISSYPNNERDQRAATETFHDRGHEPTQGYNQVGFGTDAVRDAFTWISTAARIAFWGKSDTTGMGMDLMYLTPGTVDNWKSILLDVLMARQNTWAKTQAQTYVDLGTTGATVTMDFNDGSFFKFATDQDFTLANPTLPALPASEPGACFFLEVTQAGAGGHDISAYGTNFVASTGVGTFNLSPNVGDIDIAQMLVRSDGKIHIEWLRDSSGTL